LKNKNGVVPAENFTADAPEMIPIEPDTDNAGEGRIKK